MCSSKQSHQISKHLFSFFKLLRFRCVLAYIAKLKIWLNRNFNLLSLRSISPKFYANTLFWLGFRTSSPPFPGIPKNLSSLRAISPKICANPLILARIPHVVSTLSGDPEKSLHFLHNLLFIHILISITFSKILYISY